ncbi:MAG: cyclic nucleotide-binding domain-containing protein, partial [Bacteroidota bacterium]
MEQSAPILIHSIQQLAEVDKAEAQVIYDALQRVVLEKEDFLLRAGQICRQYYFVETGTIRLFYEKDGLDYTVWMGTAGEIFTNLESYLDGSVSRINMQALEPSIVFGIQKDKSDALARSSNAYNTLLRKTVEMAFVNLSKNVISFQSEEAADRYQRVAADKNWIAKYPLKYISTFIGVTQSTLSRIRARKE